MNLPRILLLLSLLISSHLFAKNEQEQKSIEQSDSLLEEAQAVWSQNSALSLQYGKQAYALLEPIEAEEKYLAMVTLATLYLENAEFDSSRQFADAALVYFKQKNDVLYIARLQNNIGLIFDYQGLLDSADHYYQIALNYNKSANDSDLMVTIYLNLGMLQYARGNLDSAISQFKTASALSQHLDNTRSTALTFNNIGGMYKKQGKYKEAIEYYGKSQELYLQLEDYKGLGSSSMNIGRAYDDLKFNDLAIKNYRESELYRKSCGDIYGLGITYSVMALHFERENNFDSTLHYRAKSLEIQQEIEDYTGLLTNYMALAKLFYAKGFKDSANNNYQKAVEVRQRIDASPAIFTLMNLYKIRQSIDSGQSREIESLAKEVFETSQEMGVVERISQSSLYLSEVYQNNGKHELALAAFKVYKSMDDSLKAAETNKSTSRQQAKLQFQEEALLKEQAEQEAIRLAMDEQNRKNNLEYSAISVALFALFGFVFVLGRFKMPQWAIELSVFLPFLILFEFLLVYTDPMVDELAGGAPLIKLLINAVIGGIIFPLHAFFERLMKRNLFKVEQS